MNRRHLIKLLCLGAAKPIISRAETTVSSTRLHAGPFSILVPTKWSKSAVCEHVPLKPLYSNTAWKEYQADKRSILKPGYACRPEHWAIRLPSLLPEDVAFDLKTAGENELAPQILVHRASQWGRAFTNGIHEPLPCEQLLKNLRQGIESLIARDEAHPGPAFMDASLTFQSLKRQIKFNGGQGIRLVAQWTIEPELVRDGLLHYLFLGMSDDDSCQIIATFPLAAKDLPASDQKSHLGWSMEDYGQFTRSFDRYEIAAKRWVTEHEQSFTPSIQVLDTMMQSLVATGWND
ncbi:MAG: hypothetical protein JNN17_19105 [Verrucomicrobiaceae bacterium]|nr:hypothetical protein [Verrucomicrobiaceae bacterium]